MEEIKYFLSTVHRDKGIYTKGVAIHETKEAAERGFHNEFTAWAYGKVETCDYVCAYINDSNGAVVRSPEVWTASEAESVEGVID